MTDHLSVNIHTCREQHWLKYAFVNFTVGGEEKANVQGNVGNGTVYEKSNCLKSYVKGFWREQRLWDGTANVKLAM